MAADPCKNVTFEIINNHWYGTEIRIQKVQFYNRHNRDKEDEPKRQTEVIKNKVCPHTDDDDICTTDGTKLKNANQVELFDFQILYKVYEPTSRWSKMQFSKIFEPREEKCVKDKAYGPIVITGLDEEEENTTASGTTKPGDYDDGILCGPGCGH